MTKQEDIAFHVKLKAFLINTSKISLLDHLEFKFINSGLKHKQISTEILSAIYNLSKNSKSSTKNKSLMISNPS